MRNLIKTGMTLVAVGALSLVGFAAAFGYGGGGGGGGGGSGWTDPRCLYPVHPPFGGFWGRFHFPNVYSRATTIDLNGGDASYMSVSTTPDFTGATIEPYSASKPVTLPEGFGVKNYWVRFYNFCKIPTSAFPFSVNYGRFPRVLGEQVYANGTLLRGSDNRIFVVKGTELVYVPTLQDLLKYVGRPILTVEDAVINDFANVNAPQSEDTAGGQVLGEVVIGNGTLIRGTDKKIYVVKAGGKQHIHTLVELARNYLGKPIIDMNDEEVAKY